VTDTSSGREPQLNCVLVGVGVGAGVDGALPVPLGVAAGDAGTVIVPVGVAEPERLAPSVCVAVADRLRGPALVARTEGVTSGAL